MCDPISLGISCLALGAGTAALSYGQAQKQHKAHQSYQRQVEANNEEMKKSIKASAAFNAETLLKRMGEERLGFGEDIEASQQEALRQKAAVDVYGGAAGWRGRTLDALREEVEAAAHDDQFKLLRNEGLMRHQKHREVEELYREAEMGMLNLPQVQQSVRPNPLAYGLQALGSGLDAYGRFILPTQLEAQKQRSNVFHKTTPGQTTVRRVK